jgi:glyoxylase-like metal-dependent hydrolase (beta-lactamase superfamily II)
MKIARGIYSLGQRKGGNVHAFLLDADTGLTLIDTLFDTDAGLILDQIRQIGKQPSDLKHIILTHAHRSHLGGLAELKRLSGARVFSHDWEAPIIAGERAATRVSLWPQSPLEVYWLQFCLGLGLGKYPPCQVDQNLKKGDHIGPLEVIPVPGHTPGSLAFYWPERRALFAGDVIATWPEISAGWPGLTLDNKQNLDSIGLLSEFRNVEILGVGHGETIASGGAEVVRALLAGKGRAPIRSATAKAGSR